MSKLLKPKDLRAEHVGRRAHIYDVHTRPHPSPTPSYTGLIITGRLGGWSKSGHRARQLCLVLEGENRAVPFLKGDRIEVIADA